MLKDTARLELFAWLGLAAAALALTFEFSDEAGTYAWGAASWPRGIILLIAVFALLQHVTRPAGAGGARATLPRGRQLGLRAGALLLPLLYVLLLPRMGFYVTTPLFVAAYLLLLGERRPVLLAGVPLIVCALVTLVFVRLFYVALPTGNWPVFYDLSNAFVDLIR